ncbi:MAG: hypothetical protein KatS3mg068_1646 [Candidatus Sericytochromatia bacterium]|nr:MAG: hypothetical protein KatS3mg068_1646 [Candidatus Sericytochromatia bacterium]
MKKKQKKKISNFLHNEAKKTANNNVIKSLEITNKSLSLLPSNPQNINLVDEEYIIEKMKKYQLQARYIINEVIGNKTLKIADISYKIDKVLLHPVKGFIFFVLIFFLVFQSLYTFSQPLMSFLENSISEIGNFVGKFIENETLKSLVVDGIFAGVGGVLVFLPQIMILFFLLSLMEQSGYISRAAFITDKFMSYFGLNGKAFLPFLSGFACSVPAIMATRTIPDKAERMATLMVLPFITCSARLPVYVLLIGIFIPSYKIFGFIDTQGLALFFMYFLGSFIALIFAKIFRLSFFKSKSKSFFMEMPLYQIPRLKVAYKQMIRQGKVFLKKAGSIIFLLSIIIWFLSIYPNPKEELLINKSSEEIASIKLENSFIGQFGKAIEPIIRPLGYDWKIGVGISVAFGARELFISALGTIYSLGDVDENSKSLKERLLQEKDPITNKPIYTLPLACSLLIFFAFCCQCMSTLVIVKKETGHWKYSIYMFIYMTIFAYISAFLTYNLMNFIL